MGGDGRCRKCPGRCAWHKHINSHEYYKPAEITETVDLVDVKAKFENNKVQLKNSTMIILQNVDELVENCNKLVTCHTQIQYYDQELQKLAARKLAYIEEDYFE